MFGSVIRCLDPIDTLQFLDDAKASPDASRSTSDMSRITAAKTSFLSEEPEKADSSQTQAQKSELVEPLSEREIELLQLIAEGLTNQEIAARLYISLNTVKVHTRNIYGKLGVNHRTQAVAQAQRLGLLELK